MIFTALSRRLRRASLALALATACNGTEATSPQKFQLSASEAAVLVARAELIAQAHPDLEWLADSANVVLTAGAEAERIIVNLDGAERPYYSLGLQRAISTAEWSFSTFHLIAFTDPAQPDDWIVANGYAPSGGLTPPTEAAGSFGGSEVFAHLIHIAGGSVTDRSARTGTASFARGATGATCQSVSVPSGTTCVRGDLRASFSIALAHPDGQPQDSHTASLSEVTVPGILLSTQVSQP